MDIRGNQPKQPKQIPDFRLMYQLAERYSEASQLLAAQAKGTSYGCSAPMLLVDSFAVELYLKCLHVLDNGRMPDGKPTHDWQELFDGLRSHTKVLIREAFEKIVQEDSVLSHLSAINPDAPPLTDFNSSLQVAARTFDRRRYLYEIKDKSGWYYAQLIRNAIRNVTKLDMRLTSSNSL